MVDDELLRRDVRFLATCSGSVITRRSRAPRPWRLVEEIRRLARERRAVDQAAGAALDERIASLDDRQASIVARAFSVFFDLVNIAEDRQRVRVLRDRERERDPAAAQGIAGRRESPEFRERGCRPRRVQPALDRLAVELVFTAHPSEAKRRSIRAKLRRMRKSLETLDRPDLLPRERRRLEADMHDGAGHPLAERVSQAVRPTRARRGRAGPVGDAADLGGGAAGLCVGPPRRWPTPIPTRTFTLPTFLSFGSWMGGDRDGNPFVTADVTGATLLRLRQAAIDRHLDWCDRLDEMLTDLAASRPAGARPLAERLAALAAEHEPRRAASLAGRAPRSTAAGCE